MVNFIVIRWELEPDLGNEITLIGKYDGEQYNMPVFNELENEKTKIPTDHLHIKKEEILKSPKLIQGKIYRITGTVDTYRYKQYPYIENYGLIKVTIE